MIEFNKNRDKLAVIAPSSPPSNISAIDLNQKDKIFKDTLNSAKNLLETMGFIVTHHPKMLSRTSLDFFAADKSIRLEGLINAIKDPNVKIIWALRGGYGTTELISDLSTHLGSFSSDSRALKQRTPQGKLLIGYSDITTLHVLFNQIYSTPSLHAPVITSLLGHQSHMINTIENLFKTGSIEYELTELSDLSKNKFSNQAESNISLESDFNSTIEGDLIGGNLTVFCNLIGTDLHPKTSRKILIFEDINEPAYKIHRYLIHLYNTGLLRDIIAIIFGDFADPGNELNHKILEAIKEFCLKYIPDIPIYKIEGFGHQNDNYPITLGMKTTIKKRKNGGSFIKIDSPLKFID